MSANGTAQSGGSQPPVSSTDKAARRKRFEGVFAAIKDEMTGYLKTENMPEDAVAWFDRVSLVSSG